MIDKHQKAEEEAAIRDAQAESDLRILLEAAKIKRDKDRIGAALLKRKNMIENLDKIGGMH